MHQAKQFKNKIAVDKVSLRLKSGVYGFLGANGAGKTTLLRMLCGVLRPTSGDILCNGVPIRVLDGEYRCMLGYLPQDFGYYPDFTAKRYLEYLAACKAVPKEIAGEKVQEVLELVGLKKEQKQKIRTFSGGMIRRLGIAQALLNEPEILILDEPTSGLDPGERVRFRNLLSEFAQNRIVLISTHIVPDVEYIAFQNAVMKGGHIVATGTTEELVGMMEGKVWNAQIPPYDVHRAEQKARIVNLRNDNSDSVSVRYLSEKPVFPESVKARPRLEDLYLWLFPQEESGKEEC